MKKAILILMIIPYLTLGQDGIKPIIDMHLHDYTEQTYYVAPCADGTMSPASLEEYHREMDAMLLKYNVVKAVVSTIGGKNRTDNETFVPGYYTNNPPSDTVAFKKLIEEGRIKVFGEIGAIYTGLTLADPGFEPFLDICERYHIPVAIHTGGGEPGVSYQCCPDFRIRLGDPFLIEDVLVKHPNLKIYLMHAGEFFYENALRLMMQYPQLYADLGVLLWVDEQAIDYGERFLRKAKEYGLIDKVMYGSDQMAWPHAIEKSINQLNSYDFLSEQDKRKIFYENAFGFLGLDGK